jgi:uncharacterized protein
MTRLLPASDTKPWYRLFWPWFLILLPACVVVAAIATAVIAHRGADDLVVDDYYKDGLAINRRLEKQQRAQALGISARLTIADSEVHVAMTGPVTETELRLSLAHPLEADRDFSVTLARVGPDKYLGSLADDIAPRWHWVLEQQQDDGWRVDGTVEAADMEDASRD